MKDNPSFLGNFESDVMVRSSLIEVKEEKPEEDSKLKVEKLNNLDVLLKDEGAKEQIVQQSKIDELNNLISDLGEIK